MIEQQKTNIEIAKFILKKCEEEEHLRFHQLLFNLGITEFSEETIKAMNLCKELPKKEETTKVKKEKGKGE